METKEELRERKCFNPFGEYYVMIDGCLTCCKINKVTYHVDIDKSQVSVTLPNGEKRDMPIGTSLYHSECDFKKGKEANELMPIRLLLPFFGGTYWLMRNGEPTEIVPDIKTIEYHRTKSNKLELISYNGHEQLPNEFYMSRDECLKWNDYTTIELDGTKHARKSVFRSMLLTAEQEELVENLKSAFKVLKEAGVIVVRSYDDGCWYAYNRKDIEHFSFDADEDSHFDKFVPAQELSNDAFRFLVEDDNDFYFSGLCDGLSLKLKNNEDEKD